MAEKNQDRRIGLFEVLGEINSGGMAEILRVAVNRQSEYAMKLSRVNSSREKADANNQAILKEAELLRRLQHDHIVKIYPIPAQKELRKNFGVYSAHSLEFQPPAAYYIMEYLRGGDLEHFVEKFGPLTLPEAANIAGQIVHALIELHRIKYTHNDISTRNILFRTPVRKGAPFDAVLIDFGAAVSMKQIEDEAGALFIMSPERIRNVKGMDPPEKIDQHDKTKYDVWSIGVILHYMLTAKYPFSSRWEKRLTKQVLYDPPESIRECNPDVPLEVEEFINEKCLCKKPEDRPDIRKIGNFLLKIGGGKVNAVNAPV